MADFRAANKKTFAVFIQARREGRTVLLREPYDIVSFDGQTFIEGIPDPSLDMVTGRGTRGPDGYPIETEIRIYPYAPFLTRLGSTV